MEERMREDVRDEVLTEKLPVSTAEVLPDTLQELERRAESYFRSARAPNTVKAYAHDLSDFAAWCKVDAGDLSPCQPLQRRSGYM